MKNIVYVLILFFSFAVLNAGLLEFNITQPQVGSSVIINYKSNTDTVNYTLLVYHFRNNEKLPFAESIPIVENTSLTVDSKDNFLLFKIIDDNGEIDNNNGKLWDIVVYDGDKPIFNSNLNRALSYLGATGENYTRVPNYDIIKNSLDAELKFYPNNFRAKLASESLNLDFKLIDFDEYNKRIRELLNTKIDITNELDISAAIKALNSIDEKDKADELEKTFVESNPNSYLAKEKNLDELSDVNSFGEFIDKISNYLNKYYNDDDITTVYNSFVFAHSQSKEYMDKLEYNLNLLKYKPAFLYNEIAQTYIEDEDLNKEYSKKELYDRADTNIRIGLSKINELIEFKPKDVTKNEWYQYQSKVKSDLYLTDFRLNIMKNDSSSAFKSVLLAINNSPNQMNAVLYNEALELAVKYGDIAQIKQIIGFAYKSNAVDRDLGNYILSIIDKTNGLSLDYINNIIKNSSQRNNSKLRNSLAKDIKLSGFVQKLDKTFIDLDKLKGNVKIVSINSTWCDVCTQVFPILNELNTKYQADTNVSIIGISVWEDDDPISAINDMKKEYDINFPYYIDNTDILPRKLNIFGFPTILIVDKDNYVRYTIRGFNNGEELIKLIDDFVEILK